jgi:hypothetical protein
MMALTLREEYNLVYTGISLILALIAAKIPARTSGFFSLPPIARGAITFVFGLTVIGCAIILWPLTLIVWWYRRGNSNRAAEPRKINKNLDNYLRQGD